MKFNEEWKQKKEQQKHERSEKTEKTEKSEKPQVKEVEMHDEKPETQLKLSAQDLMRIDYLLETPVRLPQSYENLLRLFSKVDVDLMILKNRKNFATWAYTFGELKRMIEQGG
jgi:hypothetical protein